MLKTLKYPIFTEKSLRHFENNQYVFEVDSHLNKPKISFLVEKIFSVRVSTVNIYRQPTRKYKKKKNHHPTNKRAIVTVKKNEKIIFFPES